METIDIKGTDDTPAIHFNYDSGQFIILGRSLPEDVTSFYQPVMDWINLFASSPKDGATFQFKLEYFNTASSKIILDLLMRLEEIAEASGAKLAVSWYYQDGDPDMKEAGEEYAELVSIPFEFITY